MKRCKKMVDAGRRSFLRGGAVAAAGMAATAVVSTKVKAKQGGARVSYPASRLANIKDLKVNDPMDIDYPDDNSPGVLLRLGKKVDGGVGPNGDIVAYSTACPHKGYTMNYDSSDRTLNCPGHYSRFDCEKEGQQIWGHSTQNLAMFVLRVDAKGDIYAEGADDLIYGRISNT